MSNPQKQKGKRVEQQVCNIFSEGLGGNWQRVPNSGAFIGGSNVGRMAKMSVSQALLAKGDIIPPDEYHNLIIESKGRLKFPFHQLIQDNGCKELNGWIEQVEVDWNAGDKKGFYCVVFKPNTLGFYICYDSIFHKPIFRPESPEPKHHRNHAVYSHNGKYYVVSELSKEWLGQNREWFLKTCSR